MRNLAIVGLHAIVLLAIGSCGGGDGDTPTPPLGGGLSWTAGMFPASSTFAAQCQNPRTGSFPDRQGSLLAEKYFLRSWTDELYLWFNEVVDRDPASVPDVVDYFGVLKTTAVRSTGRAKDEFHFTYNTAQYQALIESGTTVGYGISFAIIRGAVPRELRVQYVQAGTQAANAGIGRGDLLLSIDGIDVVNDGTASGVNAINAALFSPAAGSAHDLVFRDRDNAALTIPVRLNALEIAFDAVPLSRVLDVGGAKVGYLLFNSHSAAAELALRNAVTTLAGSGIDDLVLDVRYNGGGYLDIASELAFMVAGPTATSGRTFERLVFNSKYPTRHPLTGEILTPVPFHATTQGFSLSEGQALPSLSLPRVYVLTSGDTCSASESIINGLRGIGVQVFQIGEVTCGKPYGFYPKDNCGTTYFSIQFQGVNHAGFGDYAEGFSTVSSEVSDPRANLPGCAVSDDFTHDLGDPLEGQLAAALMYRQQGTCPTNASPNGQMVRPQAAAGELVEEALVLRQPREPWRDNRMMR